LTRKPARKQVVPTKDVIHEAVKNALIKDGWTITADPYVIDYDDLTLFADLAADRALAAEKEGRRIALEIKSFLGRSEVREFETALGQYQLYRGLLEVTDPSRKLFLAVRDATYDDFLQRPAIRLVVRRFQVALVVVNVESEEINQWISD
jgi:hypothetical protein